MSSKPQRITIGVILDHMRHMEDRLIGKMQHLLNAELVGVKNDISILKTTLGSVERQLGVLQGGVDMIDKRLDDIEIEFLPKRVARLERKVFARAR